VATAEAIVTARGVVKDFPSGDGSVRVLHGVDLEVRSGELLLLVGPSGCGKTTLISILAAILGATEGRVEILGRDLRGLAADAAARLRRDTVGFIFQQYNLLPTLTAAENAAIPLVIRGLPLARAARRAEALLEELGLAGHTGKLPRQLSGGQQQRVAIARALVHDPPLIVCDEPTAALDAASGHEAMRRLREAAVRPGRAVIVVTHDPRVLGFADRIARMEDGRIVELIEDPQAIRRLAVAH
jgi:putative ABC transport system ATP-binding protein